MQLYILLHAVHSKQVDSRSLKLNEIRQYSAGDFNVKCRALLMDGRDFSSRQKYLERTWWRYFIVLRDTQLSARHSEFHNDLIH